MPVYCRLVRRARCSDEPQHIYQGEVTLKLLEDMNLAYYVTDKETTDEEVADAMAKFRKRFMVGKQAAFVIRKGALEFDEKVKYKNTNIMRREDIISSVLDVYANF